MPEGYWPYAVEYLQTLRLRIKYKREIKLAILKTKTDNQRRFVFRNLDGGPITFTRAQIKLGKAKGILKKGMNHLEIEKYAIYDTINDRQKRRI